MIKVKISKSQKIVLNEQQLEHIKMYLVKEMVDEMSSLLDEQDEDIKTRAMNIVNSMDEDALEKFVLANTDKEQMEEMINIGSGKQDVSHFAIVDEHFELYEALQDAIDENNETPCPQCLYEILADASCGCPDLIPEAEYRGRKVTLNKPTANRENPKKSKKVYVKNEKGNVIKVQFGDPNMKIKKHIKGRRKSFRARHKCKTPGPKTKARYWSCKAW